jgi:hypothetical protein
MESSQSKSDAGSKKRLTPEAASVLRKRGSLLLARVHLQHQMEACPHPRYQTMLQNALADVERQLADLNQSEL